MMEYKIELEDKEKFDKFRLISRLTPQDLTNLKNLYNKYINKYLKKSICYTCPDSVRNVLLELQRFEKKSEYVKPKKVKKTRKKKNAGRNNTRRKSTSSKRSNK